MYNCQQLIMIYRYDKKLDNYQKNRIYRQVYLLVQGCSDIERPGQSEQNILACDAECTVEGPYFIVKQH